MYYTLKCNPAQNPACGEWDYQTSTYLFQHTGVMDSNLLSTPNYSIDGTTPDSVMLMNQPSWKYRPHFNTNIVYTNIISFDSASVGIENHLLNHPLNASFPEGRAQYLWKASEMLTAGLQAGDISGMRLHIQQAGSTLKNFCIRIRTTIKDSLKANDFENDGFTLVFLNNLTIGDTGWIKVHFVNSFAWDGTSNLIVDFSFDNQSGGTPTILYGSNTGLPAGIFAASSDKAAFFYGKDFINVPAQSVSGVDSAITISFWAYGNPDFQPQAQSLFEAGNANNNRVINCHLPWSNSHIYWDAGNNNTSSYDRIEKLADNAEIEGNWNYWTVTKNATTGNQKIYRNGNLWLSGTSLTRRMYGITNFYIGSDRNGTGNYDGCLNEFALWNKELDQATIAEWMYKDINSSHPNYNNLKLYYKFDDGFSTTMVADSSGGNFNGILYGPPTLKYISGDALVRNFTETTYRPNIIFEQGNYISYIDTTVSIDSTMTEPVQVFFYSDSLHPLACTDTMLMWPPYYNHYVYNHLGLAIDSTFVIPDTLVRKKSWYYYSAPFEIVNRYELGRFITPYGNGLDLGSGFTWIYDVSDYRTLVHDSVHLSAGNWQELLNLKFVFIKGTPPRNILSIQNLWNGNFNYGYPTDPIENHLTPKSIFIPASTSGITLKSRVTGHGMDTPDNCAEFCPRFHYYKTDGVQRYQKLVWRNCGTNALYPQGGTWIYDRSNWCPGAEVTTYDFELTPFISPNDSVLIDHDVEPYTHTGSWSYYQIEDQLVTYGPPNFNLDAEIYDIVSPSTNQMNLRKNPVCNNPVIVIRNSGATTLTSLTIHYGVEGTGTIPSIFQWTGNLKFMESDTVQLEQMNWTNSNGFFYATISAPNGGTDMYPYNNKQTTQYLYTTEFPADFYIELRTNLFPNENSYTLEDDQGNIILQRNNFTANTTYKDTVHLVQGCYKFRLIDTDGDGLSFWNNNDGSGYLRFKKISGGFVKIFDGDFGSEILQQFTVGYTLSQEDISSEENIILFPNPSSGELYIDMALGEAQAVEINIYNYQGKLLQTISEENVTEKKVKLDLTDFSNGFYVAMIKTRNGTSCKKFILKK
jgi:hypothetical protein